MSKQKLNTENVLSELTGKSAFFQREASQIETPPPTERTDKRTENRSEMRSPQYPVKRLTRRYSFEFFDDQVTQVKGIKHALDMAGERVSMSDIVREALDEYLSKQNQPNRSEKRTDIRTNEVPNG